MPSPTKGKNTREIADEFLFYAHIHVCVACLHSIFKMSPFSLKIKPVACYVQQVLLSWQNNLNSTSTYLFWSFWPYNTSSSSTLWTCHPCWLKVTCLLWSFQLHADLLMRSMRYGQKFQEQAREWPLSWDCFVKSCPQCQEWTVMPSKTTHLNVFQSDTPMVSTTLFVSAFQTVKNCHCINDSYERFLLPLWLHLLTSVTSVHPAFPYYHLLRWYDELVVVYFHIQIWSNISFHFESCKSNIHTTFSSILVSTSSWIWKM